MVDNKTHPDLFAYTAKALAYAGESAAISGETRGECDAQAFKVRFHDSVIHEAFRRQVVAWEAFEAYEQARCWVLGGFIYPGAQHNIMAYSQGAFSPDTSLPQIYLKLLYAPEEPFPTLRAYLEDQHAYGKHIAAWLKKEERLPDASALQPSQEEAASERAAQEVASLLDPLEPTTGMHPVASLFEGEKALKEKQLYEEEDYGGAVKILSDTSSFSYRVYTKAYDEVVYASALVEKTIRERLNQELQAFLAQYSSVALVHRYQQLCYEALKESVALEVMEDTEEGFLNYRRLVRLVTRPGPSIIYQRQHYKQKHDVAITLLIDNSGSMRGRPIRMAASTAYLLSKMLALWGVPCEVLGFTTVDWKGGEPYQAWVHHDRPNHPGRLNALRHIIYKSFEQPWMAAKGSMGVMLHDQLLKENIDGEALGWAYGRLRKRPEMRRLLLVISDGAPVDEATQLIEGESYLQMHLKETLQKLSSSRFVGARKQSRGATRLALQAYKVNHPVPYQKEVEIMAIGIGHDVGAYYDYAMNIQDAEALELTLWQSLAEMLLKQG